MASPELSRRVGMVVGYPPLSELGERQRREFHEARLVAHTFEDLPGKWQAAILKAEQGAAQAAGRRRRLSRAPGAGRAALITLGGGAPTRTGAQRRSHSRPHRQLAASARVGCPCPGTLAVGTRRGRGAHAAAGAVTGTSSGSAPGIAPVYAAAR
jgi:hypothetical protein